VLRLFGRLELFDENQATGMLTWPHSGFHVHTAVGMPEDDRAFVTRLRPTPALGARHRRASPRAGVRLVSSVDTRPTPIGTPIAVVLPGTRVAAAVEGDERWQDSGAAALQDVMASTKGTVWAYADLERATLSAAQGHHRARAGWIAALSSPGPRAVGGPNPYASNVTPFSGIVTSAVHQGVSLRGIGELESWRRAHPAGNTPTLDRWEPELAIAYAQLGRPDLARPLLAGFLKGLDAGERINAWGRWQIATGEIALAEGRTTEAIAAFRLAADADSGRVEPAWTGGVTAALARAFDKAGRADSAAAYFRPIADQRLGFENLPLTLPIALRRLGELAEQRGDLADAIRRYRAFAYLWRNADPELQPQVAEIRARLARLEAREARSR
jgi:tetratricopeptide (TPR) repeat protein